MENAILCLTLREVGDGGRSGSCSCLLFSRAAFIPESGTIKTTVACVLYLSSIKTKKLCLNDSKIEVMLRSVS
jgi:hypothetical protein